MGFFFSCYAKLHALPKDLPLGDLESSILYDLKKEDIGKRRKKYMCMDTRSEVYMGTFPLPLTEPFDEGPSRLKILV